jgi:predicted RNA-binding protein with PUA-like domain
MQHWLVKQEPEDYPFVRFVAEGRVRWDGVRNFQARNFLRAMKERDRVLYYHSGDERAVVGTARVVRTAYPDPTADEGDWSCVDLVPDAALARPVTLAELKADARLEGLLLLRQSRLSVMPVSAPHWKVILALAAR